MTKIIDILESPIKPPDPPIVGVVFPKDAEVSAGRKTGRPAHAPTTQTKEMVMLLAAFRTPHAIIAENVGVALNTLRLHYEHELNNSEVLIDAEVLKAWLGNVRKGKEVTILRYMENKYRLNDSAGVATALPSVRVIDDISGKTDAQLEQEEQLLLANGVISPDYEKIREAERSAAIDVISADE